MDRIASIKEFLKQTPNDSFLKHALALEYIKLGNDTDARQQFEELLAHEPGYVGSYYHLGKLLERAGAEQEAIAIYEKGMEMAKAEKNKHAYNELQMALDDLL
ncbi:tetratricopeptide repeat protein [Chitinophaga sancti]|uniref:Tetratricopeptide repeat protein n=1 Tax=Chitinophaga sancti TaxID=1004 RepID=A0A1K1N9H8_9BACT|nr:tetratricopeptide repeat protein [Chitinophaga sancti]WQD63435.1 tetratricopeptide repeat protein [Chitinophaga sancti]WQG90939.1 tetratricopeptide repeat protein [Chitinophaga sancti]SFW32088.1 Tetratricopeptide repeat-containing protein [Chitinophaga sancti]